MPDPPDKSDSFVPDSFVPDGQDSFTPDFSVTGTAYMDKPWYERFWDRVSPGPILHSLFKAPDNPPDPLHPYGTTATDIGTNIGKNVLETGKGILDASDQQLQALHDYAQKGDYLSALGHAWYSLPVLGGMTQQLNEDLKQENYAGAAGDALGLLGGRAWEIAKPYLPEASAPLMKLRRSNPQAASAVDWGLEQGIPVPAGPATGNKFIIGAQRLGEHTPLGSFFAESPRQQLAESMAATGSRLAEEASPGNPVVPEIAGEAVESGLQQGIARLKKEADSAYGKFHDAEKDPANIQQVQTGTRSVDSGLKDPQGNAIMRDEPVMEDIAMPVDMRPIKAAFRAQYERMSKWLQPSFKNSSAGYTAMGSIVNGPDFLPAVDAEEGLKGLKSLAREADSPDLRNFSQGIAANATGMLQDAIDNAVGQTAGPEVLDQLRTGRATHAEKMGDAEVLDKLRKEPVQLFNQLTYAKDAGIGQLRRVADVVPEAMPGVGRAYVEQLLKKATGEGGFQRGAGLWRDWENLGDSTKQVLFKDPGLRDSLNKFFQLSKMLEGTTNPSGSAVAGLGLLQAGHLVTSPLTGLGEIGASGLLTKALYNPTTSRMLTQGLRLYLDPTVPRLIKGVALAQIQRALGLEHPQSGQTALQPAAAVP